MWWVGFYVFVLVEVIVVFDNLVLGVDNWVLLIMNVVLGLISNFCCFVGSVIGLCLYGSVVIGLLFSKVFIVVWIEVCMNWFVMVMIGL